MGGLDSGGTKPGGALLGGAFAERRPALFERALPHGVLAQLGMAESLYYFVPRNAARTPRYVCNALLTLAAVGLLCLAGLYTWRFDIAARLSNASLAGYMTLAGLFLTLMLMSSA